MDVNAMLGVGGDVGYGGCEPRIEIFFFSVGLLSNHNWSSLKYFSMKFSFRIRYFMSLFSINRLSHAFDK